MKILHRCLLYCLLAVVLTVLAEGCTSRPMSPVVSQQDSLQRRHNDSLLWLARKSRQVERVFAIVDSLQQQGVIGPVRADYERGNIYYMLNRKRQGERYWRRALKSEYTTPDEERYYFSTATYLVNKLQVKHDFDGALQVAIKTSAQMKQSKMVKPISIGIQLGDVGICQLKIHRIADARKSFQESSVYLQKAIETDSTLHSITNALVVIGNTIIFCLDAKCYDETAKWLEYDDSLLAVYCRLGMVNQHKHLLKPGDQCIGGGYYHFDFVSNRILLDRESYDFGRPKWHLLETLKVPSTYRGMRIVYSYDDGFHDDFNVSEKLQIEYYD